MDRGVSTTCARVGLMSQATRIMIVDDQVLSRQIFKRIIASVEPDADFVMCASGEEALNHARENAPDLVLTDYRMNGMNGIALMFALRAMPTCEDVPIVMITAVQDNEIRYQALELGATDFL